MFSLKKLKGYSDISSLKDARWAIQHEYAKEKGYPLWSLKYCNSKENSEDMRTLIDNIIRVVSNPESMKNPQLLNDTINGYDTQKYEWGNLLQENNGGNYKEGFDNFIKSVEIVNIQDSEIDEALKYLHGHLEGEVGLWSELDVKDKLKDWRMSQQAKTVPTPPVYTNDENDNTSEYPVVVSESSEETATKRSKLKDKLKFMPTSELKEVIDEIVEKENGYILDILLKYVQ